MTFPLARSPRFVDWADYEEHQLASNPTAFAQMLDEQAGADHDVWVVWSPGYRTFENFCEILDADLGEMRPAVNTVLGRRPWRYGEAATPTRYPGTCRRALTEREQEPTCPFDPVTRHARRFGRT